MLTCLALKFDYGSVTTYNCKWGTVSIVVWTPYKY